MIGFHIYPRGIPNATRIHAWLDLEASVHVLLCLIRVATRFAASFQRVRDEFLKPPSMAVPGKSALPHGQVPHGNIFDWESDKQIQ